MPIRKYKHVPEPGIVRYDASTEGATQMNFPAWSPTLGIYVVVGEGGLIMTSPTGVAGSFTTRTSGTVQNLNFVSWIDRLNTFVALGNSNTLLLSSNGVDWADAPARPVAASTWSSLVDNGTVVCIVGGGGNTLTTADFSSYTAGTFFGTTGQGSSVVWTGSRFVAGVRSFDATNAVVEYSVDGVSWSRVDIPHGKGSGTPIEMLLWTGTAIIAVGANGFIATAGVSGTTWVVRPSGTTQSLRIMEVDDIQYVFGGSSASRQSTDNGVTWTAGPAMPSANFIRGGTADGPAASTGALLVGGSGALVRGQYGLRVKGYADDAARDANDPIAQSPVFAYADQPVNALTVDLL